MASLNKFNTFVQDLAQAGHNLASGSFKVMLTNTAPVATNAAYSDLSGAELANGNGYTTGGAAVTITSATQASGVLKWILQNVVFTASGSMGPFRYAALYNTATGKLIGWWDYGSSITLASTDTFTWVPDGTNGLFSIT